MKKKPLPVWLFYLAPFVLLGLIALTLCGIWHNIKCALGIH